MKRLNLLWIFTLLLFTTLVFNNCGSDADYEPDPAFTEHISAFTSGIISAKSTIKIKLKNGMNAVPLDGKINDKLFKFSPSVKGKTVIIDSYNIEFIPDEPLKQGQHYNVSFNLNKLIQVPKELETFKFNFETIEQSIDVQIDGLSAYNSKSIKFNQLQGSVFAADAIDEQAVAKCIDVQVNTKTAQIIITPGSDQRLYTFTVDSIERTDDPGNILITWDGGNAGIGGKGSIEHDIPALGDFKITDISVINSPEQYVSVRFSDPIKYDQDLNGLVFIENKQNIKLDLQTNELRLYPDSRISGDHYVRVSAGVKNSENRKIGEDSRYLIRFEAIKPNVRFLAKGNILPSSNNMMLPFEAVNLKAVDVKIIKIYRDNMSQFFQNNDFDGERELKRVGRLIRKKTIELKSDKPLDYGRWNRFNLDLSKYLQSEPGAMYRVILSFRKHQSAYPCDGEPEEDITLDESDWDEFESGEKNKWAYSSDYSTDYYEYNYFAGYSYQRRDNPCSYSYYRSKSIAQNIYATDLGLMAKTGSDGKLHITVTNLLTAEPVSGAEVEVYNYQQKSIGQFNTGKNGTVKTPVLEDSPFLITAKNDDDISILRLAGSASRSLSKFDVDGAIVKEGLKGYIYGERGVWRPGDSLFLTFVLEDKEQLLPKDHPVVFELRDPQNRLTERLVRKSGQNGFYSFKTKTDRDAPTGNWGATVTVGNAVFSKLIKIETVKPNRLKIRFDNEDQFLSAYKNTLKGNLEINWLHGAPGKNLKAETEVKFIATKTKFDKFNTFTFDDPVRKYHSTDQKVFEGTTNDKGKAYINTNLKPGGTPPGMLKAVFKTRAYERGGNFSTDQFAVNFSPYEVYAGIRSPQTDKYGALVTDTTYLFDIATASQYGEAAGNRELKVEMYRIRWNWWWERGEDQLGSYIGRNNVQPVFKTTVKTKSNGLAQVPVKVNKHDWGRYLIRVTETATNHTTGVITYFDWPHWMSRSGRAAPDGANMLTLSSDKEKYAPDEKAKISFPSAGEGKALITIENGKTVKESFWTDTQDGETQIEIPVKADMAPNIYVNITMLQPHGQTLNDAPLRMYGVIPIEVEDPETRLFPVITMQEELAPESTAKVQVSEENGRAMTYTLAIVDEGLLDLTRFKTPDPHSVFYAREALGVNTWDLYDKVIGAFGARIENLLSTGGDVALNPGEDEAVRFKPMVRFVGPFTLKKGQKTTHEIDIPNYIGSVRTMLVAGNGNAYGHAEKTVPVKKPLMVLSTLPRVLGPGESVKLPVTVFAMDDNIKNVKLTVKTNNLLSVQGSSTKNLSFSSQGDDVVEFDLETGEKTGKATVQIVAGSGSEKSTYEIELNVRNPNLPVTRYKDAVIEAGQSHNFTAELPGAAGSNTAVLEVSAVPPVNLEKRLGYLMRYPHGCLEQTISGAFPQLYLADITTLSNEDQLRIKDQVTAAINKVRQFQLFNGGMSYWPSSSNANDWVTSYTGHFLFEAEQKGYSLPYGFKSKWISYQKSRARSYSPQYNDYRNSDLNQAYRLYTLALAGEPDAGSMNRLRENPDLSAAAAWRLAAAYALTGKPEVGRKVVSGITNQIKDYTRQENTFGSSFRDEAMILETSILLDENIKAAEMMKKVADVLGSDRYLNTQATSFGLLAAAKYTAKNSVGNTAKFSYNYGGKSESKNSNLPVNLEKLNISANQTEIAPSVENRGDAIIFARLVTTGTPMKGVEQNSNQNLKTEVRYTDVSGNSIAVENIEQGADFIAEVTVSNPGTAGDLKDVALSQIFPSGWEIHNRRMDIADESSTNAFDYQDIRDDRIYTYFDLKRNTKKTFIVKLHAAYRGTYYLPPVHCEAMYDNTVQSIIRGKTVRVTKPGNPEIQ